MKNIVALIIAMIMLLAIASAEVVPSNAAISINGIRTAFFAEDGTYLPMQESDGLVYAPAEQLGSYLGLDVEATANGVVKVNGIPVALFDENGAYLPSLVLDGVVYVPVKAFAESLSIAITVTGKSYALENAPAAQKTPEPTPAATQAPQYGYVPLTSSNFYDYFSVSYNITSTGNTSVSPYYIYTTFTISPTTFYDFANVRVKIGSYGTETLSAAGPSTFRYSDSIRRSGSQSQFIIDVANAETGSIIEAAQTTIEVLNGTIRMSYAEAEQVNSADYQKACNYLEKKQYQIALDIFEALARVEYLDSKEQAAVCRQGLKEEEAARIEAEKAAKLARQASDYETAQSLVNEGKLEEALNKFKALSKEGYLDSADRASQVQKKIWENTYNYAVTLQENDELEKALEEFETLSRENYLDSADRASQVQEKIWENAYNHAVTLYENKKYEEALQEFNKLYKENYKQTQVLSWQQKCQEHTVKVGDYVTFGHYPQTKAGTDNTPIEWLVLERDENKALLISRYALDCQPYNSRKMDMTWQRCSLRTWLNGKFINKAFTSSEQKDILTTNVDNGRNQGYKEWNTNGGNNTQDNVFLLSNAEAGKYFKNDSARKCVPTEYAVKQGTAASSSYKVAGKATCYWWLRSPGNHQYNAVLVKTDGALLGYDISFSEAAVRPAIWVNLGALSLAEEETRTEEVDVKEQIVRLDLSVGDTYKMGAYEQDNNTKNGKEAIEWIVADVQGDEALLISKYAIEAMAFNTETKEITWEKSSIRKWLNGDFVKNTFTAEEQAMIAAKSVNNDNTQGNRSKNGGATTTDQVFLLSYAEVQKYFSTNKQRICTITPYAAANAKAAYSSTDNGKANGNCWWWLRTPGDSLEDRDVIETDGSRNHYYVNRKYGAVRPAMWIKLTVNSSNAKPASNSIETSTDPKNAKVGDYITFGHYPQTKVGTDNTPIEWLVLARDGNKALLISRYALDCQPYNSKFVDMTWQKCSLRTWLNGTFLNKAFTSSEQKGIVTTKVDNSKSQGYSRNSTKGGNNTQDKVFLLSYAEAWKYFKDNNARKCVPTEYAVKQGAYTTSIYQVEGHGTCYWLLRSPGYNQNRTVDVAYDGSRDSDIVGSSRDAVRPALWINLESGIF